MPIDNKLMWLQQIEESGLTKCYSWNELVEMGRKHPAPAIPPKPEDLCTIMYTSGTTGNPKVKFLHLVTISSMVLLDSVASCCLHDLYLLKLHACLHL